MRTVILLILSSYAASMVACAATARVLNPGPAQLDSMQSGAPQVNEFDILRLRIMERMANGDGGKP